MKNKQFLYLVLILILALIPMSCSKNKEDSNIDPQTVVENYFKYCNEKDKDKVLTTLTKRYDTPNMVWGFDNLEYQKIISIVEEQDSNFAKGYLSNGNGSVNGTKAENLKVFKIEYEVKYKQDGIGPQDSGKYMWWFYVIREDEKSPWLIDDMGV